MNCVQCGEVMQPQWKACPKCGQRAVEKRVCPTCGQAVDASWQFCPSCGTGHAGEAVKKMPASKPVERVKVYDFLYSCGLDADEADKRARSWCNNRVSDEEFSVLTRGYEWALSTLFDDDDELKIDALDSTEEFFAGFTSGQFQYFEEFFEWAFEDVWACDSDYRSNAVNLTRSVVKTISPARFNFFKEVYTWAIDDIHGSDSDFRDEALSLARELTPLMSEKLFEQLKESYARAIEEMEKEPEDALRYARKRLGLGVSSKDAGGGSSSDKGGNVQRAPVVDKFMCPGCGERATAKDGNLCPTCNQYVHRDCAVKGFVNWSCPACGTGLMGQS